MKVKSEDAAVYAVTRRNDDNSEDMDDKIIRRAIEILTWRMKAPNTIFNAPDDVKQFLQLKLSQLEHEVFCVIFLDPQNGMIAYEEMFRGTVTQTSVYPREVVKQAIKHNSSAVVLAHNHPSGSVQPSRADESLTQILKSALALIDVRVLDHIVVGGISSLSFAETGLL